MRLEQGVPEQQFERSLELLLVQPVAAAEAAVAVAEAAAAEASAERAEPEPAGGW